MRLDQETFEALQHCVDVKTELHLINVYKGMPVSYPGVILSLDSEQIIVKTERMQVVCLYRDRQTFIQGPFPKIIHADVLDLNTVLSEVILHNFKLINHIGIRAGVRVEPRDQLGGAMTPEKRDLPINVELADISQNGVGLYIHQDHFSPVYFAVGQEVIIHLVIPLAKTASLGRSEVTGPSSEDVGGRYSREDLRGTRSSPDSSWLFHKPSLSSLKATTREIKVKGMVVNISYHKNMKRYRTGIKLNPADPQRNTIGQFIVQRQSEILQELREVASVLKS